MERIKGNNLHHRLTALSHKTWASGLEIKHHSIHRGAHILVADIDLEFSELAAEIGQLSFDLLQRLLNDRNLPQAIYLELGELAINLTHLVALLQILQLGRCPNRLETLKPLQDFGFKHEVLACHRLLGVIEVEIASQLNFLETQLGLLGDDGGTQAPLTIEGGLVVEAQQHLALRHPLPVLDQHGFQNTAHRHLDGFDIADWLELARGHHHLIGFGEGQPGQASSCGAH